MENIKTSIAAYNPNGVGVTGTLFGLPFTPEEAQTVIIPMPWEVTVSYGAGCARGIEALLHASPQLDVYDEDVPNAWQKGVSMLPIPTDWLQISDKIRGAAKYHIDWLEKGSPEDYPDYKLDKSKIKVQDIPTLVNNHCVDMVEYVRKTTTEWLEKGKKVGLLGGDHSTPLGFMQALAEKHKNFGILQIDAHADLRDAYEGFVYSHASIMYNALQIPQVSKLVQVGIRDYCEAEAQLVADSEERVITFYDSSIKNAMYEGKTWKKICKKIIKALPQKVYVSFDIDGLDPKLCPHTGTPVAGGFELQQCFYLLKMLVESGREIIAFDLCEVGNDEWDGNVGARVLYKLTNLANWEK